MDVRAGWSCARCRWLRPRQVDVTTRSTLQLGDFGLGVDVCVEAQVHVTSVDLQARLLVAAGRCHDEVFPLALGVAVLIGIRITSVSPSRLTVRSSAIASASPVRSIHHRAPAVEAPNLSAGTDAGGGVASASAIAVSMSIALPAASSRSNSAGVS